MAADRAQEFRVEPIGEPLGQLLDQRQRVEPGSEFNRQLGNWAWTEAIDVAKIADQPGSAPVYLAQLVQSLRWRSRRTGAI
jgi:hypothetical protein